MQRTFVIGDIHGAAKALEQCLVRASVDLKYDTIIQLGDVTDGYPDVCACVDLLLRASNLIALKGNHDDWFMDFTGTAPSSAPRNQITKPGSYNNDVTKAL